MSRSTPLYKQIKASILASIRSGALKPGDRVPSEHALAKQAGVSRITTKQALNELAQEGWVRRVRGKGTFVADPLPASPSYGSANSAPTIGIVVPHLNDSYATRIVLGVEAALAEAGYHLVFRSGGSQEEESESIRDLARAGVRGIIVWPSPGEYLNRELLRLYLNGFPIVLVDRYLRGLACDCAQSDNLRGGLIATRHLLQLGHRAIAYVARHFQYITSVEERFLGYQVALTEAEIPWREEWLWLLPRTDAWETWLRDCLEAQPEVTAVFCENDHVATGVIRAAERLGLAMPEDLSVVGFDDIYHLGEARYPLTTVRQDAAGLGRAAARLLLERLTGRVEGTRQILLPVELVVRSSTAPPRQGGERGARSVAKAHRGSV